MQFLSFSVAYKALIAGNTLTQIVSYLYLL